MTAGTRPISLLIVLCLALLLRLGWALSQNPQPDSLLPDQAEYLQLADNLLEQGRLVFFDPRFGQDAFAFRMPGYPLFLALCGNSITTARMVQVLLDTSTVLAVFLLARQWLSQRQAMVAAAAIALNPFLIYHSSLLLSETLFTAILAWAMLLLIRPRGLFWGGWLLAMAAMVRPSAFLLPIILPLLAALLQHQEKNIGRIIVRTMAIGLVLLVLMGLWAWRNNCVLGRPIWTTTNQGITRLDGFNPQATGASNQAVFLTSEELAIASNLNEVQRDQRYAQMAGQWIDRTLREDPWRLVRLTFVKIARTWSPMPLSSDFGTPRHILAAMVWAVPFYLLVILGLLRRSLAGKIRLLLVVPAFYFTITVALSVGSLRYRIPVEPVLAVIAGSALWTKTQAPKMT